MTPDIQSRVKLINEPGYRFGSVDNALPYDTEVDLTEGCVPSSIHGVIVDDRPVMVIGDDGGATGIHANSILRLESRVFIAIGAHVICFTMAKQCPDWTLKVDTATFFGIYYDCSHDALISHGEVSICRFTRNGEIIWSESGFDIFTGDLSLLPSYIEVIDFNHNIYFLDYGTGEIAVQ